MDIYQIINTIKEIFVSVKDFFISLDWPKIVSALKVVSVVISALLFIGIIDLIIRLNLISRVKEAGRLLAVPTHSPKKLIKKWSKIEKRLKSDQEAELKLAVIEADKFLDDILKRIGYFGKDMGERLRKINSSQIANIDDIWQAHKVRNNIVHDVDYKLTEFGAERAVRTYKEALEELEAL
jgi:hypothetical protein